MSSHTTEAVSGLYLAHVKVNKPQCEPSVKGFRSHSGCIIAICAVRSNVTLQTVQPRVKIQLQLHNSYLNQIQTSLYIT